MTPEEQIYIYNDFLILLHTAIWTGNHNKVKELLKKLSTYSSIRTNNFEEDNYNDRKEKLEESLKDLNR